MKRRNRIINQTDFKKEIESIPLSYVEATDKYLGYHLLKNNRLETIKTNKQMFDTFGKFLESEFPNLLSDINLIEPEHIELYVKWSMERGNKSTTINKKVNGLKYFFRYLLGRKMVSKNPVEVVPLKTVDKKPKVIMTRELLEKAVKETDKNSFVGIRSITIAYVLFNTGLRIGELKRLKVTDVDFKKRELKIEESKNRKYRIVPINKECEKYLKVWLKIRGDIKDHDYIFINELNQTISIRTIQQCVKDMFANIGHNEIHCHSFRKGFISSLVEKGVPLTTIAAIVGHSNLNQLMTYTGTKEEEKHKAMRSI